MGWRLQGRRPGGPRRDASAGAEDRDLEATLLPHLDEAYNLARWLTPSAAEAEAAVERGVMKALAEYRSFRDGDPRIWVLRSVHDTAWLGPGAAPGADGEAPAEPDEWSALAVLRDAGLTPQTLLARVQARHFDALLGALPAELREIIVLFELTGASYREVATITGAPVSKVMSRLWQARCMLVRLAGRLDDEAAPDE